MKINLGGIKCFWLVLTNLDRIITHNLWLNCEWCNVVVPSPVMGLWSLDGDFLSICIELVYTQYMPIYEMAGWKYDFSWKSRHPRLVMKYFFIYKYPQKLVVNKISRYQINIKFFTPIASPATAPESLLTQIVAQRINRKRTAVKVAFT